MRILLVVATILVIGSILAVWANRQMLNANNWASTSTSLLQNSAVRTQVADYLTDQIYAHVDVTDELRSALPPRLKPLAGPAAGALRDLVQKVTFELLGRPRVQEAWRTANRITAQEFINIAEGKSKLVTLSGNAVFVDLRPIVSGLAQRLGLPSSLVQKIPASAGRLKVMSSNQISTVQSAVELVRGLAIILPVVALLLFALAVYLATGRRRHTLLVVGVDLVIAGAIALIARNVAGNQVVNALANTDSARPAVEAVWSIGTGILSDVAQSTIVFGLAVMLGASLASPRRPAPILRRAAAPWFRERPGVVYAAVIGVLLLIVLWGPIPATRMPIPVLIMLGLVCLGTEALRRQTAAEFPDAQLGDTWAAWRARASRAAGSRRRPAAQPPIAGGSGELATTLQDRRLAQLERLVALRDAGALTEQELMAEKAAVLAADRDIPQERR